MNAVHVSATLLSVSISFTSTPCHVELGIEMVSERL